MLSVGFQGGAREGGGKEDFTWQGWEDFACIQMHAMDDEVMITVAASDSGLVRCSDRCAGTRVHRTGALGI